MSFLNLKTHFGIALVFRVANDYKKMVETYLCNMLVIKKYILKNIDVYVLINF